MSLLTITRALLERHAIKPDRRLGQNFLVSQKVIEREVEEAELKKNDTVLEVGPGIGNLTAELLKRGGRVVAVEKSGALAGVLEERFSGEERLEIICGDFLTTELSPFNKVVANIPYDISSPFIFKLLSYEFELAVVIFQYEFARRLFADPGSGDYSRISAAFSFLASGKIVAKVGQKSFYPPPRVLSAIVKFRPREEPPPVSRESYMETLRLVFPYRRKTLKKALRLGAERTGRELDASPLPRELLRKRVMHLSPREIARVVKILYERE